MYACKHLFSIITVRCNVRGKLMRFIIAFLLILAVMTEDLHAASEGGAGVTITPAGSILIRDGGIVPPFPKAGKWTELAAKSFDSYEIAHFIYIVPSESPAIELYVTMDRRDEPPDGVFEIGLVQGFVHGFASKAGLKYEDPVFEDRLIGPAKVKHILTKIFDDRRTLCVHAYIYPRKPSLTFIVIRAKDCRQEDIETYLIGVKTK
jgi:hypothetical protein